MDGFKVLTIVMAIGGLAQVVLPILAGVVLCVVALRKRHLLLLLPGLALAAVPVAIYLASLSASKDRPAERLAEIAALERHPLPADYPRRLFVKGDLYPGAATALVVLDYFDEIAVEREPTDPGWSYYAPRRTPECIAAARDFVATERGGPALVEQCVARAEGLFSPMGDVVELRTDSEAKNAPKTVSAHGVAEIALVRGGTETLVDYRERPVLDERRGLLDPTSKSMDTGENPDPVAMLMHAIDYRRAAAPE